MCFICHQSVIHISYHLPSICIHISYHNYQTYQTANLPLSHWFHPWQVFFFPVISLSAFVSQQLDIPKCQFAHWSFLATPIDMSVMHSSYENYLTYETTSLQMDRLTSYLIREDWMLLWSQRLGRNWG